MSGAGKSTALRCFEDMGYFCVDNVPPQVMETLLMLLGQSGAHGNGVAFVCDIRAGALFNDLQRILEDLATKGVQAKVIFLDAQNSSLINRYKELRRQHPQAAGPHDDAADQQGERQTSEVGIAVRGELRPGLEEPAHRQHEKGEDGESQGGLGPAPLRPGEDRQA